MKRTTVLLSVLLLALGVTAGSALANGDPPDESLPEHPHVLLLNVEFGEFPNLDFDRCIDLAANQKLPLNAHHESVHTGTAGFGDLDVGLTKAGHAVIPMQPFPNSPFEDCADVEALLS